MKESLKTALLSGTLFGMIMGFFAGITKGFLFGIITDITLGVLFGLAMGVFVSLQSKKFKKNSQEIVDYKKIVFEGVANHFKGAEGVGGCLYLTEDELIFKSHNINIQNHKLAMPLNQIVSVQTSFLLGFIPNGLKVVTNDGVEKFVVLNRKEWVHKINASIN